MTTRTLRRTALAALAAGATLWAAAQGGAAAIATEQVEAGATAYAASCAACHGAQLEGMAHFPALADGAFRTRWTDRTLGELYTYVHDQMPLGAGGTLDDATYAAIVAYLLERNGVEPGDVAYDPSDEAVAATLLPFGP